MRKFTRTVAGWTLILGIAGGSFALNEARMAIMNYSLFVVIFFLLNVGTVLINMFLFWGEKGADEE